MPRTTTSPKTRIPKAQREAMRELAGITVSSPSPETIRNLQRQAAAAREWVVRQSYTTKEAAAVLGVTEREVRRRAARRRLYGFKWKGAWRLPKFQFVEGGTVPGIEVVFQALPAHSSTVGVCSWMTHPSPNCYDEVEGRALSPREWLLRGHPVNRLVTIARFLGEGL